MTFSNYVKGLKKITLEDIKKIIDDDLKNNKNTIYGFREQQGGILFFGDIQFGGISNPYVFMSDNEDNLCCELYKLLQDNFLNNCNYSYEHDFSGQYDYFASINNDSVVIYFPSYKQSHQSWIYNQVELDKKTKKQK